MSIFKRLITAVRGGASEIGEAIVDTQAFRILDQEIRDAKQALTEASNSLANVVAEKIAINRALTNTNQLISENETYVFKALDQNDEPLALSIADKISTLETDRDANQAVLTRLESQITTLTKSINKAQSNIQSLERELKLVETTDKVQRANALAGKGSNTTNATLHSATESLARIKERQQYKEDLASAHIELAEASTAQTLQSQLEQAGIISDKPSANSVLDRLKQTKEQKKTPK